MQQFLQNNHELWSSNFWSPYGSHLQNSGAIDHGLSSSPDCTNRFPAATQLIWQQQSNEIIKKLSHEIETQSFEQLYRDCAKKRGELAKQLGPCMCWHNGRMINRTYEYGQFRHADHSADVHEGFILDNTQFSHWSSVAPAIFRIVNKLIDGVPIPSKQADFSIFFHSYFDKGEMIFINIKSPEISDLANYSKSLATIILPPAVPRNAVLIYYLSHRERESTPILTANFKLAERYLDECRQLKRRVNIEPTLVLRSIARLSHLLAHMLPVRLGNAAIMGWMQHGIARYCGIELGDYSQRTGKFDASDPHKDTTISWDFMALVTPNREVYADWFARYAFVDYIVKSN